MNKMTIYCGLGCIILIFSCKRNTSVFKEVSANGLTIQSMQLQDVEKDNKNLSYKVRLIPNEALLKNITAEANTGLMYKMDSCFYLNINNVKTYAALTQSVANGVRNTYEYFIQFEVNDQISTDSIRLIYQDKYLNHKNYILISNPK